VIDNFNKKLQNLIFKQVSVAPLASFRILFGAMVLFSSIRFVSKGWIELLYIKPKFYFSYEGFSWIQPFPGIGMYIVYAVMIISALGILLGFFYRIAAILFFLSFTYVELLDKTNYLNHYYFVSIVSLLMCILPANKYASLDIKTGITSKITHIPNWCILILQLQIGIVYFFAGIAKINPDWLLAAQPLKIWLKSRDYLPVVGHLFSYNITAYLFSWFGMLFDVSIFFFLLNKKTRPFAYLAVIFFHLVTGWLFQIGVFPYVMIVATWIFFSADFHQRFLSIFYKNQEQTTIHYQPKYTKFWIGLLVIHFTAQALMPFRYLLYPEKLFWTEQGYRFSWRVMLMEKNAYISFVVKDKDGKIDEVRLRDYLTPHQEKQMSTQPDMIIQFAHFLAKDYNEHKGYNHAEVYVESYAALNGHPSRAFINNNIDLAQEPISLAPKKWILPFNEKNN